MDRYSALAGVGSTAPGDRNRRSHEFTVLIARRGRDYNQFPETVFSKQSGTKPSCSQDLQLWVEAVSKGNVSRFSKGRIMHPGLCSGRTGHFHLSTHSAICFPAGTGDWRAGAVGLIQWTSSPGWGGDCHGCQQVGVGPVV